METFGAFVMFLLIAVFIILGFTGLADLVLRQSISKRDGWECTQSAVVSPKDVKPAVETCVQYTKYVVK